MAGTRGKVAAVEIAYDLDGVISLHLKRVRSIVEPGRVQPLHFWSWEIRSEGVARFKGADLITNHMDPDKAAHHILKLHCPADGMTPAWFGWSVDQEGTATFKEPNAKQEHWFKVRGPRMAPTLVRIEYISHYPGAQLITSEGLMPFVSTGSMAENIGPGSAPKTMEDIQGLRDAAIKALAEDESVTMGDVSEDTRRAIEAQENRNRDSGNVSALTPTLLTSPFSG